MWNTMPSIINNYIDVQKNRVTQLRSQRSEINLEGFGNAMKELRSINLEGFLVRSDFTGIILISHQKNLVFIKMNHFNKQVVQLHKITFYMRQILEIFIICEVKFACPNQNGLGIIWNNPRHHLFLHTLPFIFASRA
jgi:hypothetical protein